MLKLLATILDIATSIFAILAPVAAVHWIMQVFDIPALVMVNDFFKILFTPLNAIVAAVIDPLFHSPTLTFYAKTITLHQGIGAIVLMVLFFLLAVAANYVKGLDEKMEVAKNTRHRMKTIKSAQAVKDHYREAIARKTRTLVFLRYPFYYSEECSANWNKLREFEGKEVPRDQWLSYVGGGVTEAKPANEPPPLPGMQPVAQPGQIPPPPEPHADKRLLEFTTLKNAIDYLTECGNSLLTYYARLRPMDPQPPFKSCIHITEHGFDAMEEGIRKIEFMLRFTGDNQVVISKDVLTLMNIQNIDTQYPTQSQGMFEFKGSGLEEIFLLKYKRTKNHKSQW